MTAEGIPRVTALELRERRQGGADLVVVDVRSAPLFHDHRVPGAISIPKDELDELASVLGPEQGIVFY